MADEATGTAILHEETLKELGLSEQPFVDGKKPHRFTDSQIQKTRASLEQHARFGEPVHLVLGETGAGKTILLSQLIKHCKNTIKPFVAKGSEGFVAEAFLVAVLHQLGGEECETMTELVESLTPQFAALSEKQFSIVLAIDDAHLAPVEEIAELINVMPEFNAGGEITARLLLIGEPKLKSSLDAIAQEYEGMEFDPSVSKVSPMTEAQMRDYLSSRLNHAGHTDVFPFTEKALAKIHRESAGLPAHINTGGAHYLNTVYANVAAGKASGGLLTALGWPVVALGAAAVGLIAWGLSMFIGGDNVSPVVTAKPPTIVANAPVEIKLVENEGDAQQNQLGSEIDTAIENLATSGLNGDDADSLLLPADSTASQQTTTAAEEQLIPQVVAETVDTSPLPTDPVSNSQPADTMQPTVAEQTAEAAPTSSEPVVIAEQNPIAVAPVQSEPEQPVDSQDTQVVDNATTEVTETVIAISDNTGNAVAVDNAADNANSTGNSTLANTAGSAANDNSQTSTVAESEVLDLTKLADSDAASVDTNDGVSIPLPGVDTNDATNERVAQDETSSVPVVVKAVENERWVLFQEPTHFTVQLATSRERDYILELAQGLKSEAPVAIYPFRTTNSQNPVFGLLSGLYKTRTEAINAVDGMSKDIKKFGVWIRPISDLQAAIKNNQQ